MSLHEEVVGLDVPVDEVFRVNVLYPRDQLVRKEKDGLEAEPPRAEVEEVLEAGTEELHDHDVEIALGSTPLYGGDAHAALHDAVELGLDVQLGGASS